MMEDAIDNKRFGALEQQVNHLDTRMGAVENKVDQILTHVTRESAKPRFDIVRVLQVIGLIVAILTPIGALSLWMITVVNAAQFQAVESSVEVNKVRAEAEARVNAIEFRYLKRDVAELRTARGWTAKTETAQ